MRACVDVDETTWTERCRSWHVRRIPEQLDPGRAAAPAADMKTAPVHVALAPPLSPIPVAEGGEHRRTPMLPPVPLRIGGGRGTLTVMNGLDAGRIAAIEGGAAVVVGRDPDVDLWSDDPSISRRHARFGRDAEGNVYVEDLGSTNGTFVRGQRVTLARLAPGDYVQLGATLLVRFEIIDGTDEALRRQLYEASVLDPLTHAYNRRYFAKRLAAEVAHARRGRTSLAALMFDVDHFKEFNDRFGHLPGDRALCFVTAQVMRLIREEDLLARYGGDEFVALARTPEDQAVRLAGRLRGAIA